MDRADKPAEKIALKIGCTCTSAQYVPLRQKFLKCLTCGTGGVVCNPCALVCHKGHSLELQSGGQEALVVCDCGKGKFSSLLNDGCYFNKEVYFQLTDVFKQLK